MRIGPANCWNASVSVLKPDGTTLVGPFSFTTAGGFIYTKLTVSGTYTVLVDYQGASIGNISVSVSLDNTPPSAPTLTLSADDPGRFRAGSDGLLPPGCGDGNVHGHRQRSRWRVRGPESDLPRIERRPHADHGRHGHGIAIPPELLVDHRRHVLELHEHGDRLRQGREQSTATFTVRPDFDPHDDRQHRVDRKCLEEHEPDRHPDAERRNGSGVAATYRTTNGTTPTTSSPTGTAVALTSDGVYTIKYFSVDNVTNTETVQTASTQIRIDKTAPTVTMTAPPASIRNGQALTAAASDASSGVASVTYLYSAGAACTPNTTIGTSTTGPTTRSHGPRNLPTARISCSRGQPMSPETSPTPRSAA